MQPSYSVYRRFQGASSVQRGRRGKKIVLGVVFGVIAFFLLGFYSAAGPFRFFLNHTWDTFFGYKEYLVLFQNNDELRPGGGFITAYANVNLFFGIPTEFAFHNSYEVDTGHYVVPPYPHEELLKNEWYQGYTFRDANWNPNFPDAAKELVEFYQKKFPDAEIDGIAVLNFSVIENLVKELGPVDIDGQKVDDKKLFSFLEFQVGNIDRHNLDALAARKNVLNKLADQLISKARWNPFDARSVLDRALEEKDLYFWFKKTSLESRVAARGWGNALMGVGVKGAYMDPRLQGTDFLGINIANLGSKKADRYLIKNAEYYVDLGAPVPVAHLKVALNFPGPKNSYSDPYRGYLRVILPAGYTVTHRPEGSVPEKVSDFQAIGVVVKMNEDSGSEWTFDYTLPRSLLPENGYRLYIAKQPGDRTNFLVAVTGPLDAMFESSDFDVRENKAFWRGTLSGDTDFSLTFTPDRTSPYPLEQVFDGLGQVSVVWNEPMDEASVNNPKNYAIRDLNVVTPVTDMVKVESAATDGNITHLKLSGVTEQHLEQYRIWLKDIRDRNGNTVQTNPKEITVVQR